MSTGMRCEKCLKRMTAEDTNFPELYGQKFEHWKTALYELRKHSMAPTVDLMVRELADRCELGRASAKDLACRLDEAESRLYEAEVSLKKRRIQVMTLLEPQVSSEPCVKPAHAAVPAVNRRPWWIPERLWRRMVGMVLPGTSLV